ncbi:Dyp-type peroxidase [Nostoc sp. CHAB 5784]|uniref:Dyp-type peroxidase n=1 Tax=Nostoc mirabile TaxID=2907820 RepID=UPI001E658539|nr:Dyp-type peroxidase domain-containing protein [Nostoc mirabile]MCC5669918.1 Dyp-type peroxidase [Nostoc mirabile CHAB5784]
MALTEEDLQIVPKDGIDPTKPGKYETLLSDLQGNILKGHGRDYAVHLFLQFKPGQTDALKEWIQNFANRVTSAQKQSNEAERYRREKIKGDPFVNFLLSRKGYESLGFEPYQIPGNEPFRFGMKNDSVKNLLRDPAVEDWEPGFQDEIHALLLIADDNLVELLQTVNQITRELYRLAQIVHREDGFVLRNEFKQPIEHFGFVDGVSQPLFLKQDVRKAYLRDGFEEWDARAPLSIILAKDPNGKLDDSYGSYLVYRKLEQDVEGFLSAEQFLTEKLGIDKELAGALMMGRFRDGTPLTLSEIPATVTNDFNYDLDRTGTKCPFHAHIRKSNPRGDTGHVESSGVTESQSLDTERNHRIARRGINFGACDHTQAKSTGSGLLFLCFQADITNQFNFIQASWSNINNFVQVNVGPDPIIAQTPPDAERNQKWPKKWGEAETIDGFNFPSWVHLKGGEYFFSPSISFLKNLTSIE